MSGEREDAVGFVEDEVVSAIARKRNAHFVNKPSNRPLSKDYEKVGMWGEWEFGKWSGIMPKLTAGGDGGYDFALPVTMKVDVKTSKRGDALLVEVGKVKADIYVLAKYEDTACQKDNTANTGFPSVTLVGWATAQELLAVTPSPSPRGIVNHAIAATSLRTMESLKKLQLTLR